MDIYQAAKTYVSGFRGFNLESGVPSSGACQQAMKALAALAAQSDMPTNGRLRYLDHVIGMVAGFAPQSAATFAHFIVDNPEQREFAKTLEIALAAAAERSPETWNHILHHTSLTMLAYERIMGGGVSSSHANVPELLTLFVGAMGHDIGKIGIDPALLHKSTRVDRARFAAALEGYRQQIPYYPEKLHDMIFLEEANLGRILFAKPGEGVAPSGNRLIKDLGKDLRRSEEYWVQDDERQRHNAIWQRINRMATQHIPQGWLSETEQAALTMPQRGTVTPEEMRVIESHDAMSEAFFAFIPIPADMQEARNIVSMDRFRQGKAKGPGEGSLLADIIHTTDVFEALTADRSYRKPYTVEEALKVMDGMARDNKVSLPILALLKDSDSIATYAQLAGLAHSKDLESPAVSVETEAAGGGNKSPEPILSAQKIALFAKKPALAKTWADFVVARRFPDNPLSPQTLY